MSAEGKAPLTGRGVRGEDYAGIPVRMSEMVKPGTILLVTDPWSAERVTVLSAKRNQYGEPTRWLTRPVPGYTRCCLGVREAARDRRRSARRTPTARSAAIQKGRTL